MLLGGMANTEDHRANDLPTGADRQAERALVRRLQGQLLRRALTRANITQGQLARATGIPQSNLSAMTRGELGITPQRLTKIATALGVQPQDLIPKAAEIAAGTPEEEREPSPAGANMRVEDFVRDRGINEDEALALRSLRFYSPAGLVRDQNYWEEALRFIRAVYSAQGF